MNPAHCKTVEQTEEKNDENKPFLSRKLSLVTFDEEKLFLIT